MEQTGILGVDISAKAVEGSNYTVVQLLVDDERPDGDTSILSCPLVAEITRPSVSTPSSGETSADQRAGDVVASALFDHVQFREKLRQEREAGENTTRGILVLDGGELPPRWARLAFVPIPLRLTAGLDLRIHRTNVEELNSEIESAFAAGRINEMERANLLVSIDQHHPSSS